MCLCLAHPRDKLLLPWLECEKPAAGAVFATPTINRGFYSPNDLQILGRMLTRDSNEVMTLGMLSSQTNAVMALCFLDLKSDPHNRVEARRACRTRIPTA